VGNKTTSHLACKDLGAVSACSRYAYEGVVDIDTLSGWTESQINRMSCESSCLAHDGRRCVWTRAGKCVPSTDHPCRHGEGASAHTSCKPEIGTASRWPRFSEITAEKLFTFHADRCLIRTFLEPSPDFHLLQSFCSETPTHCDCSDQPVVRMWRAQSLKTFYSTRICAEHIGFQDDFVGSWRRWYQRHTTGESLPSATDRTDVDLHNRFVERYVKASHTVGTVHNTSVGDSPRIRKRNKETPKAIFVLGASGSGKTFTTKALLREVLARNGWNQDEAFFSIDGGLMRDVSEGWAEVKRLAFLLEVPGFIDAYSSFQSHPASVAKEVCVDSAVRHNANLLIPDTAVSCGINFFGCPVWSTYKKLASAGYDIVFVAVNTDRNNCLAQGQERATHEGKAYSAAGWVYAMRAVGRLFTWARSAGNTNTFLIVQNNNQPKIHELECLEGSEALCRNGALQWHSYDESSLRLLHVYLDFGRIDFLCHQGCMLQREQEPCPDRSQTCKGN